MMASFFIELSLIIFVATILGIIAKVLKQPAILAYVVTGILLGPMVFGFVQESKSLEVFAQIGVALLLFIVGISLNPKLLKGIGKVSLITGFGQVIFTSIFGFVIAMALGFGYVESMYISIALTFSSTIIIIKLLTDKNDLETLYGRIAVGILIIQDFIAIIALILISGLELEVNLAHVLLITVIKAIILFGGVWLIYKIIIKHSIGLIAKNQELLFLGSISWCFIVAAIALEFGFNIEVGAFLAGFALASSEFGQEISSKIKSLRDFFIAIFFINLGLGLIFSSIQEFIWPIVIFSFFILICKPLIVFVLMTIMGYRSRTSFLTGLTVAQISEFSLILMALGLNLGHVGSSATTLVTIVGIITITASTYLICTEIKFTNYLVYF